MLNQTVSGSHAFSPPNFDDGDQRGPCPGLNALANHNYIPHTGITSLLGTIEAINKVFGMQIDLATLLAVMGVVLAGSPLSLDPSFSINVADMRAQNLLGNGLGLLGEPRGLNGSHNIIESDSSNTRGDIYVPGNNGDCSNLRLDLFEEWYSMYENEYDMDLMAKRASIRMKQSIAENPYFWYGPITGLVVRNAGYVFGGRLLANHSGTSDPTPHLSKHACLCIHEMLIQIPARNVMKSFWAVEGEPRNFKYNKGHERIPENWYRSPIEYGLVDLNFDILAFGLKYPELLSVGGNTGKVNTFSGLDVANVTGGVYKSLSLLEGNNLMCFALEIIKTLAPSMLSSTFRVVGDVLGMLTDALPFLSLDCPVYSDLAMGGSSLEDLILNTYPGATMGDSAW